MSSDSESTSAPSEREQTPSRVARKTMEWKLEGLRQRKPVEIAKDSHAQQFRVEEVLKHDKPDDCWIIVNRRVYDVAKFAERHPGGYELILKCGGRDVTEFFHQYHPSAVYARLPQFYIGDVVDYQPEEFIAAVAKLGDEMERDGFFVPDVMFSLRKLLFCFSLLLTGTALILLGRRLNWWWLQMMSAPFIAGHLQQVAFLGHDTGHCAFTGIRWIDLAFGLLCGNFLSGLSIGWWKDSHNTHHILTNVIQHDPDIQHLPFLAISNLFFRSLWSFYYSRKMTFDWIGQQLVSYQHLVFYPLMAFARWNLYFLSIMRIFVLPRTEARAWEIVTFLGYWCWLGYLLSFSLNLATASAILLISHAIAGILHVQIVLSHLACDVLENVPYTDDKAQWFAVQLRTSLDVDCPPWMDWFHGGLQFQVAHHLFPRMPRHNLRRATERLAEFCKKHDKNYQHDTFIECNKMMIRRLYRVAVEARKGKFVEKDGNMLWDGMFANG
eukprot:GHVN01034603.1.p1 GENE.GHVN01034603.1~~GHVN01034603.1.p1  ORF type:complete len:496 (-),score=42.07 GHVN01034603.1:3975-5462(-)